MQKLTIDIDDSLLKAARIYASEHHTTLSYLIQTQLAQLIGLPETEQPETQLSSPKTNTLWILENDETLPLPEREESLLDQPVTEHVEEKIAEMFSQLLRK